MSEHELTISVVDGKRVQVGRCSCGEWWMTASGGVFYAERLSSFHATHCLMAKFDRRKIDLDETSL